MVVKEASSFRDTAAEVIIDDGIYYRRINNEALADYETLMQSGLYQELTDHKLMIPHTECEYGLKYTIIRPQQIGLISYPYEWCFSMMKEAAINTLICAITALRYGMMMKDASAFNMQWVNGVMQLIDTTSFMRYQPGMVYPGYQQYIQHFVAPMLLMKYGISGAGKLSALNVEGIPVNLLSSMLPFRARLDPQVFTNIYLPVMLSQHIDPSVLMNRPDKEQVITILKKLLKFTQGITYRTKSAWSNYENEDSYTELAKRHKRSVVRSLLENTDGTVLDIGANTGEYSRIAYERGHSVIALDNDHDCIENNNNSDYLSLVVDICNPTPAIGWQNQERKAFLDRINADTIMALALIHHLCVGSNIPVGKVAGLFAAHCRNLIIEFVPLQDKKAQILLGDKNIPPYSREIFESEFGRYFYIAGKYDVEDSQRSIYLFKR